MADFLTAALTRLRNAKHSLAQGGARNDLKVADAMEVWEAVVVPYDAGRLTIEEFDLRHKSMAGFPALLQLAERERDAAIRSWDFPSLMRKHGTTFDRFDMLRQPKAKEAAE